MHIELGEKNGKKIPIYIEGKLIGSVYPKEINEYALPEEGIITEEIYEKLVKEILIPRAKQYVMNMLVKSDRTEAELRRKLIQAGYGEDISKTAIEYVKSFHYIDELRTAESFIRNKMNCFSEKEIRYKLSEKGIGDETVDLAYDAIVNSEETEDLEIKAAENFLRKKLGSKLNILNSSEELSYEEKNKLMAAAYRKGFRQENIKTAFKKMFEE